MNSAVQIIERAGKPEWAVIPYEAYIKLEEAAAMLADINDYDAAKAALHNQEDELVPAEVASALLDGKQPIKVWREYRQMTRSQLANAAGISVPYLSQIESAKRTGTKEVLLKIAHALELSLDDIVLLQSSP